MNKKSKAEYRPRLKLYYTQQLRKLLMKELGYKNILHGALKISLLRLGIPLQTWVSYRNQTWLPGKNYSATSVFLAGVQVPVKFW